jgi:hypothetical protein
VIDWLGRRFRRRFPYERHDPWSQRPDEERRLLRVATRRVSIIARKFFTVGQNERKFNPPMQLARADEVIEAALHSRLGRGRGKGTVSRGGAMD